MAKIDLFNQGIELQTAFIIVRGQMTVDRSQINAELPSLRVSRPSLKIAALSLPGTALRKGMALRDQSRSQDHSENTESTIGITPYCRGRRLLPGDTVGVHDFDEFDCGLTSVAVSASPCWILEIDKANTSGIAWLVKARAAFLYQQKRELEMLGYP